MLIWLSIYFKIDRDIIEIIITYSGVNMKIINLMILSVIVLLIAIGSVSAGTDEGLLSDGDDFDEDIEDDFGLDVGYDNDDSDDDLDDLDDDLDDLDDDSDDLDDDSDDEDESFDEEFDGEFDEEFTSLSAGFGLSSAKGMNGEIPSNSAGDYQNSMDLSPKTGNPIGVLLFSLLFLIVIPLRNR